MSALGRVGALAVSFGLLVAALAEAQTRRYQVSAAESRLGVHVGRAGLFKVFGHDHWIVARDFEGYVIWDDDEPERSEFVLEIDASSLVVSDESLGDNDRREVQTNMESRGLGLPESRTIRFESTEVRLDESGGGSDRVRVRGVLALRGVESEVEVRFDLRLTEDELSASGSVEIDGRDWGVPQIAAAGGAVKTKNELRVEFELAAPAAP